ncbi:MAG: SPFH domain-containing protein [Eubacteriales bacterium]
MAIFNKPKASKFIDEIRCDEPSYLIWKWHPADSQSGKNNRENAIRWGSSLRVKDGEMAVFVYNQPDGTQQDFIEGPYDGFIETANFPILASIIGLAYAGGTPFQAEVYYINLAQIIQVKFGVPYFDVYDPRFDDFGVPVAVRGTINFKINDYRRFIKLHRLTVFNLEDFQKQIRDAVCRYIKDTIANAPATNNIPLVQIETKTSQINDVVEYDLGERLKESFGVSVSSIDIDAIELDKTSEGYRQLMAVTKDIAGATAQAQAQAKIKDIADKQRIEVEHYEGTLRIQREEGQYAQHKLVQTSNIAAYQTEAQTLVGIAGANALGKMGGNGAGGVDLGGNGAVFNPAAMMAGIAVGGVIGQNIAGTMNNMMSGVNGQTALGVVPPPIPTIAYHVAVNGQETGPYDFATLIKMAAAGQLTSDSLVWKVGMSEWVRAVSVADFKGLFMPPVLPTNGSNNKQEE